jgi:signal transduction histidine kinase
MNKISATNARVRVDRLIGRCFAAASIFLSIESGFNLYNQVTYLNQTLAWFLYGLIWLTTLACNYTFWFGSANYLYVKIHALNMFVVVLSWPVLVTSALPQDGSFYPWFWWGIDTGWVAAALAFKWRAAASYYVSLLFLMGTIFTFPVGGNHSFFTIFMDTAYTFLTNASISIIALMIRASATSSDKANSEAIQAEIMQAQAEGRSKERLRLDGLIHDTVLTALTSATQAKNDVEAKASGELAKKALEKLSAAQKGVTSADNMFCGELFDSIALAAKRINPEIEIKKNCLVFFDVSAEVVSALTEATIQAIHNSLMHAGSSAKRELSMKSTKSSLKIMVKDDGRGFRVSQISRAKLGVRVSIIGRVESAGGVAHIISAPGQGTTVVLEWTKQ